MSSTRLLGGMLLYFDKEHSVDKQAYIYGDSIVNISYCSPLACDSYSVTFHGIQFPREYFIIDVILVPVGHIRMWRVRLS